MSPENSAITEVAEVLPLIKPLPTCKTQQQALALLAQLENAVQHSPNDFVKTLAMVAIVCYSNKDITEKNELLQQAINLKGWWLKNCIKYQNINGDDSSFPALFELKKLKFPITEKVIQKNIGSYNGEFFTQLCSKLPPFVVSTEDILADFAIFAYVRRTKLLLADSHYHKTKLNSETIEILLNSAHEELLGNIAEAAYKHPDNRVKLIARLCLVQYSESKYNYHDIKFDKEEYIKSCYTLAPGWIKYFMLGKFKLSPPNNVTDSLRYLNLDLYHDKESHGFGVSHNLDCFGEYMSKKGSFYNGIQDFILPASYSIDSIIADINTYQNEINKEGVEKATQAFKCFIKPLKEFVYRANCPRAKALAAAVVLCYFKLDNKNTKYFTNIVLGNDVLWLKQITENPSSVELNQDSANLISKLNTQNSEERKFAIEEFSGSLFKKLEINSRQKMSLDKVVMIIKNIEDIYEETPIFSKHEFKEFLEYQIKNNYDDRVKALSAAAILVYFDVTHKDKATLIETAKNSAPNWLCMTINYYTTFNKSEHLVLYEKLKKLSFHENTCAISYQSQENGDFYNYIYNKRFNENPLTDSIWHRFYNYSNMALYPATIGIISATLTYLLFGFDAYAMAAIFAFGFIVAFCCHNYYRNYLQGKDSGYFYKVTQIFNLHNPQFKFWFSLITASLAITTTITIAILATVVTNVNLPAAIIGSGIMSLDNMMSLSNEAFYSAFSVITTILVTGIIAAAVKSLEKLIWREDKNQGAYTKVQDPETKELFYLQKDNGLVNFSLDKTGKPNIKEVKKQNPHYYNLECVPKFKPKISL